MSNKAGKGNVRIFGIGPKNKKNQRSKVVTLPKNELYDWGEGEILSFYIRGDELILKKKGK